MHNRNRTLLALAIAATIPVSCVTGGGGSEHTSVAGAVLVFSQLATSAEKGDQAAKKTWCEAYSLVSTHTLAQQDGQLPSESAITEKLMPDMHDLMRRGGYAMHRQQLAIIVRDAYNVAKNPEASAAMQKSCLP